jgi:hypothetical protein
MRRILTEIGAPLPQDKAWNAMNNPYNRRAYERICREFGISSHTDWRSRSGLGTMFDRGNYMIEGEYNKSKFTFAPKPKPKFELGYGSVYYRGPPVKRPQISDGLTHISYIKQTSDHWTEFICIKSEGFTRPGVERLNDSIRTYVWAILGAQSQTRTGILGTGTAFDAQNQFLVNIESAIDSPVDIPSAIKRYQDVLRYARSKVDFVFGIGLYMAPSNMELRVGTIEGYNNEITIATSKQHLGLNSNINSTKIPSHSMHLATPTKTLSIIPQHTDSNEKDDGHEDQKRALIIGLVAAGLFGLWVLK